MDDQQADPGETTTGISSGSSSTTPQRSSSCRSGGDEPDKFVGGARGSASRRRERGADQQLSRSRLNKGHGGVRFQAAGHDQDGGSTVQADGGRAGDPADESTVPVHAKHEDGRSMGPPLHKKKMGQQADQEETRTGISTSRAPPPAGRSGDEPDHNFDGGVVIGASRPRGRWAADYRPSRNRPSEGYYYGGGVRDLRPDEGFRFPAAGQYDQDGGSMVQAADGGRIRDLADENTVRFQAAGHDQDGRSMISRAPPPAGRSGDEPDHNFDGGVAPRASRPRGRWAADYWPSRNRPNEEYYYGGGVRDLPDEDFRFQAEFEYYGYLGPSRTRMDHQSEGDTTGTGGSTPPPPPCRSGGQPDNFDGGVVLGASRPRGRWAADYRRPSRNRANRGYGGVRDLRPDEGDRFQAAGHDLDGRSTVQADGGGVHFQAEQQEDGGMVRSPDAGDPRSQAEHESGSAVPADGGGRDPADGGARFRGEHEDGGLRVYDNVVVGDPSGVVFGRRNYAGGKVRGQVSGNRVIP